VDGFPKYSIENIIINFWIVKKCVILVVFSDGIIHKHISIIYTIMKYILD